MMELKQTKHNYQGCLCGNHYDSNMTGIYDSWDEFSNKHYGFCHEGYDDTYNFVFRYDIHKQDNNNYTLELCIMLQRKGVYTHLYIRNVTQNELNTAVYDWLDGRKKYILSLWDLPQK